MWGLIVCLFIMSINNKIGDKKKKMAVVDVKQEHSSRSNHGNKCFLLAIRKNAVLRHLCIGFTFQTRKLHSLIIMSVVIMVSSYGN